MPQKYNLALRPLTQSAAVIATAERLSDLAYQYQLGKNALPHVTLYQFYAEDDVIKQICESLPKVWHFQPLTLKFNDISCKTFGDTSRFVALMPDQRDILFAMHAVIAKLIQHPEKKDFDPHMTLINTRAEDFIERVGVLLADYKPITDEFTLVLGKSDIIGQFLEELQRF